LLPIDILHSWRSTPYLIIKGILLTNNNTTIPNKNIIDTNTSADMNNRHQSYIWNEVADKLARQAGPVMSEQFQLELTDVVVFPNDSSMEQFSGEVEVELKGLNSMSYEMEKNVLNVLAEVWGIPASTIKIIRIGE